MKRALRVTALSASVLAALVVSPAQAAPSIWDRARDPAAASQQLTLNRIERLLGAVGLAEFGAEMSAGAIALSQLGQAPWPCLSNGASAPQAASDFQLDARLEYLIGGALVDSETHREAEARCVLEHALKDAPNSPLAAHGWADLASAAAKMGDRVTEHAAYLRALEVTWDPDSRANLIANLAESDMALGDLPRAIREYRMALQGSQQSDLAAGAYFGLAVALDRSGDLPGALGMAKRAVSIQLPPTLFPVSSVLDLPNVFFTPAYEVHYYKALGAMATAQLAKDDAARRDALADAAEEWSAYLVMAEVDHTPWAARAALHQASVARQLAEVSAKLPKVLPEARDPALPLL